MDLAATSIAYECAAGRLIAPPRLTKRVKTALESQRWRKKSEKIARVCATIDGETRDDMLGIALSAAGVHGILSAVAPGAAAEADKRVATVIAMLRAGDVHFSPGLPRAASAKTARCCAPTAAAVAAAEPPASPRAALRDLDDAEARGASEPRFQFAELFAGIGGFRLGLEAVGGRCMLMAEQDPWCHRTVQRNFADKRCILASDVTQLHAADVPVHHILTAGFPCQSFSSLGARRGLADETNGALIWHVLRLAQRCRPAALLLENVRGLLTIDDGETVARIVEAIRSIGYDVDYRVVDSSPLVPQHRDRVYFVAVRRDILARLRSAERAGAPEAAAPEAAPPEATQGVQAASDEPSKRAPEAAPALASIEEASDSAFAFPFPLPLPQLDRRVRDILEDEADVDPRFTLDAEKWDKVSGSTYFAKFPEARLCALDGVAQTVGSSYKRGWQLYTQFVPVIAGTARTLPRFFTPREVARLQGFPESFVLAGDDGTGSGSDLIEGRIYKQLGNAVSAPVIAALGEALVSFLEGRSDAQCAEAGCDAARRFVASASGAETRRHCFALVPFSMSSPLAAAAARELEARVYRMCSRVLRIEQHNATNTRRSDDGSLGFGTIVYDAAFVLADFIEHRPGLVRQRSVLELGCGSAALVSIVAALCGARVVVATDGDGTLVDGLAARNISTNLNAGHTVVAEQLLWGSAAHHAASLSHLARGDTAGGERPGGKGSDASPRRCFDVIVAADVVAVPYEAAYKSLLDTFCALSNSGTTILLAYTKRHGSERKFFVKLKQRGFACEALPVSENHVDFRGEEHPRLFRIARNAHAGASHGGSS